MLRLPDGSKVVLNSSSTVFFASAFGSNERQVSVNGEAWFDVVKDPGRPFFVHVPGLKIEVSGTRFNVQAYKDENVVRTSLVEGNVKVTAGNQEVSLKPGEQAVLTMRKLEKVTNSSAIKKATAWRSGTFIFENDDIRSIIRQLCRSYDLDVEYKGKIPDKTFDGVFYHNNPVELILGYLHDRSGIKFTKKGNKIIVQP
jgi:ferric-dicitrate binding protein FerR (iron transport regulator)